MPETDPAAGPARPRRRFTIRWLIAAVAVAALALGAEKRRRDAAAWEARRALLRTELTRATYNAMYSEGLLRLGQVPAAQAAADRMAMDRARAELESFEGRHGPR